MWQGQLIDIIIFLPFSENRGLEILPPHHIGLESIQSLSDRTSSYRLCANRCGSLPNRYHWVVTNLRTVITLYLLDKRWKHISAAAPIAVALVTLWSKNSVKVSCILKDFQEGFLLYLILEVHFTWHSLIF